MKNPILPRVSIRASPKSRKQKAGEKGFDSGTRGPSNCAISQICSLVRKKKKKGEKRNEERERERGRKRLEAENSPVIVAARLLSTSVCFPDPFSESSGRLV